MISTVRTIVPRRLMIGSCLTTRQSCLQSGIKTLFSRIMTLNDIDSNVSLYQRMSSASSRQGNRPSGSQDDLAVFRPGDCRYAVRERPGFLMDDCLAATKPHNRGVASRAVRLLPDLDVSHGDPRGDMGFLSPLRLPGNR